MKLKPLEDRVVIERIKPEETTPGGIVLPDSAKEKPQRGIVRAAGPGRFLENGNRLAMTLAVGDEVLFHRYGGNEIEVDDKELLICRESEVLAKF